MAKVLVFDPDPGATRLLLEALTSLGHSPVAAKDGYTVLLDAERAHPDLVVLDYKHGAAEGFEILQRLRKSASIGRTPVIFVSETPKYEIQFRVMDDPLVGYCEKPMTAARLGEEIAAMLGSAAAPAPAPAEPAPPVRPAPKAPPPPASAQFGDDPDDAPPSGEVIDLD